MDVVSSDVPIIIRLPDLCTDSLLAYYIDMVLIHKKEGGQYPFTNRYSHILWAWPTSRTNCSKLQPAKIYQHFHHATLDKLYHLLLREQPDEATKDIHQKLHDIAETCKVCREYRTKPFRFQISLSPDKIVFNHELAMELVWLDVDPVLRVIDTHTNYHDAT